MSWCDQLHDPTAAEASGKISVANSRCQTNIPVRPWSHPAAEQHPGGRNNMIQSDLQSCLAACSKSSWKTALERNRPALPVAFLRTKGWILPQLCLCCPRATVYCPSWMQTEWGHSVSPPTVLASQAYPWAVSFKEVFLFNHCNYYNHFKNQEAANLPVCGSMWSTIKIHTSNYAWAQKFMKPAYPCQLCFHSA